VDCSGLIIDCARRTGFDASGWHSQRMWAELPHVQTPEPGDVALYAPRHVVMVESYDPKTRIAAIIAPTAATARRRAPLELPSNTRSYAVPHAVLPDGFLGLQH